MCLCVWRFLCACVCCILSVCMCVAQLPLTLFSAHSVFIFIALYSPPLGIFHSSPFGFSFLVAYFTLGFWPRIMMTRSCPLPQPFLSLFVQHSVCTSHIAIALHIATGTTNSRRSSSDSFCFFLFCSYFCSVIFAIQRFVQRSVAVTFFVHFISVILRCN